MARVIITQKFVNDRSEPNVDGKYVFPIPPNSSVCSFEMRVDRGPVLVSITVKKDLAIVSQDLLPKGRVALVSENGQSSLMHAFCISK
jgi:hypothetical protein